MWDLNLNTFDQISVINALKVELPNAIFKYIGRKTKTTKLGPTNCRPEVIKTSRGRRM